MGLFGSQFAEPYEDRVIERYEGGEILVSTCRVPDSSWPMETAIAHPAFKDGHVIVVEGYANEHDAKCGHERWVEIMTSDDLPEQLQDVGTSMATMMLRSIDPGAVTYESTDT